MKAMAVFQPVYLKPADLNGKTHLVHIERVVTRDNVLDSKAQTDVTRHILYLHNAPKGLMLNITQTEAVVKATGQDDTDNWPGQSLLLEPIVNEQGYPTIKVQPYDPSQPSDQYAQFAAPAPRKLPSGADVQAARNAARAARLGYAA